MWLKKDLALMTPECPLDIDTAKERRGAEAIRVAEQFSGLLRAVDVATEENDSAGTDALDPAALFCGECGGSETCNEDLAGLFVARNDAAPRMLRVLEQIRQL